MVDADLNDNQSIDANGFVIRIPNELEIRTQISNTTGVTAGQSTDPNQVIAYANSIQNDYRICGDYEASILYDCMDVEAGVLGHTITLDFSQSQASQYGTVTLLTRGNSFHVCDFSYIDLIQADINSQIATLASPLKDELKVNVTAGAGTGNGILVVEMKVSLPGSTTTTNGPTPDNTYQDVVLSLNQIDNRGTTVFRSATTTLNACDGQDYTGCLCEGINQLALEYKNLVPGTYTTIHQAIAAKYNQDFGLSLTEQDIRYILKGYCGQDQANNWTDISFSPFELEPGTPAMQHLPIGAYPISTMTDLEDWKQILRADPAIAEELKECATLPLPLSCQEEAYNLAIFYAQQNLQQAMEDRIKQYQYDLENNCMSTPLAEDFSLSYTDKVIHYTLYYYDASGNLERTVPPTGVHLLNGTNLATAATKRQSYKRGAGTPVTNDILEPTHKMQTTYTYNTLNEVLSSTAPDRGTVYTYYDILGRPVFSQDAQQVIDGQANYMIYDALGRITETGLVQDNSSLSLATITSNITAYQTVLNNGGFPDNYLLSNNWTKSEIRKTYYNEGLANIDLLLQEDQGLRRNRVAAQTYSMDGDEIDYSVGYNYDVFGNAKEIWQHYPQLLENPYKQMVYDYDLISGVVHQVDYQKNKKDQLSFRYAYDANNRLIKASSSINDFVWNTEARYEYYLHGPLKRVELGTDKVQGCDYVYTLQGWIKGVNSNTLQEGLDPGQDGFDNSTLYSRADIHQKIGKDAFGYAVHYNDQDYKAINSTVTNFSTTPAGVGNLYNGNISGVTQAQTKPAIGGVTQTALPSILKQYRYDQLHRIVEAKTKEVTQGAAWGSIGAGTTAYQTTYSYDPNGNILNLQRHDQNSGLIDNLSYAYYQNGPTSTTVATNFETNKLAQVTDGISTVRADDLESQTDTKNYVYDANGSLIADVSENIAGIEWTSEKKVRRVERGSNNPNNQPDLEYVYDFQGNRIEKVSIPVNTNQEAKHTIYVRDPQGNIMGTYEYQQKYNEPFTSIYNRPVVYLKEQMIYGSDRLGVIKRNVEVSGPVRILGDGQGTFEPTATLSLKDFVNSYLGNTESNSSLSYSDFDQDRDEGFDQERVGDLTGIEQLAQGQLQFNDATIFGANDAVVEHLERIRGNYRYELKNFRGDVRQIITDVKHRLDNNNDGIVDVYTADVMQVADGYSFGWDIAERSFTADDGYRFGFNGKENDGEWGTQHIQDYGFRLYNPAIGKFLSVDPLSPDYPWYTPYQFAGNKPINSIDLDGLEEWEVIKENLLQKRTTLTVESHISVENNFIALTQIHTQTTNDFVMSDKVHNNANLKEDFNKITITTTTFVYINSTTGELISRKTIEQGEIHHKKIRETPGSLFSDATYTIIPADKSETSWHSELEGYETPILDQYIQGVQDAITQDNGIGDARSHNEAVLMEDRAIKSRIAGKSFALASTISGGFFTKAYHWAAGAIGGFLGSDIGNEVIQNEVNKTTEVDESVINLYKSTKIKQLGSTTSKTKIENNVNPDINP